MRRFRTFCLFVLAAVCVIAFCHPFEANAAPPADGKATPVTVINTPLPVTVETFGTDATASVVVTNTAPVPVTVTNNVTSEATRESIQLNITQSADYNTYATVSLQKPGVIETISAFCYGGSTVNGYTFQVSTDLPNTAQILPGAYGNVSIGNGQQFAFTVPHAKFVLVRLDAPTGGQTFGVSTMQSTPIDFVSTICSATIVIRYNP